MLLDMAKLLKYTILFLLWMEFIWQAYLNRRQFDKARRTLELPREIRSIMPPSIFRTSREYTLATLEFHLAKSVVGVVFSTIIINGEYMEGIWSYAQAKNPYGNEIVTSCIWLFLLCSLTALVDLPFDFYLSFILERSFDMQTISLKEFLIDRVIGFLSIQVSSMSMAALIVLITQYAGRYFFILLWFVFCIALSTLTNLASVLLPPPSTELIEFPEGDLKHKIENLCKEIDFPQKRVEMLMHSTSMDEHSCVFYYGIFSKHVVISVNIVPIPQLPNALNEDEIVALLAHQLGHWYNMHSLKKFFVLQAILFLWFYIFIYLSDKKVLYEAFGFHNSQPVLVGIMISIQYVMMPYNVLIASVLISLTRKFEFEADIFAAHLGMKETLKRALMGIYEVSFKFPILDDLYSKHSFYQPSLLERIRNLNSNI